MRPNSDWFNNDILEAKINRNKAERIWRDSKLTVHKQIFKSQKLNLTKLIRDAKRTYYSNKIDSSKNTQKELFKVTNSLLNPDHGANKLPETDFPEQLPERFSNYFSDKINKICENFQPKHELNVCNNTPSHVPLLHKFMNVTESDISKIINNSA